MSTYKIYQFLFKGRIQIRSLYLCSLRGCRLSEEFKFNIKNNQEEKSSESNSHSSSSDSSDNEETMVVRNNENDFLNLRPVSGKLSIYAKYTIPWNNCFKKFIKLIYVN